MFLYFPHVYLYYQLDHDISPYFLVGISPNFPVVVPSNFLVVVPSYFLVGVSPNFLVEVPSFLVGVPSYFLVGVSYFLVGVHIVHEPYPSYFYQIYQDVYILQFYIGVRPF